MDTPEQFTSATQLLNPASEHHTDRDGSKIRGS